MENVFAFIISVIGWAPVWIPIAIVTSPIWGLALFGMCTKPIHNDSE